MYVRETGEDNDLDKKILNYTFDKVENDQRTLSLNIQFENPSAISVDITELDILEIKFKDQDLLVSADTKE